VPTSEQKKGVHYLPLFFACWNCALRGSHTLPKKHFQKTIPTTKKLFKSDCFLSVLFSCEFGKRSLRGFFLCLRTNRKQDNLQLDFGFARQTFLPTVEPRFGFLFLLFGF
jgi:hypothetical protein